MCSFVIQINQHLGVSFFFFFFFVVVVGVVVSGSEHAILSAHHCKNNDLKLNNGSVKTCSYNDYFKFKP